MEDLKPKRLFFASIFFILGVIATIFINKYINNIFPDNPIVIKSLTDTVRVVHEFKFSQNISTNQNSKENQLGTPSEQKVKKELQQDLAYFENLGTKQLVIDSTISNLKKQIAEQNEILFRGTYNEIIEKRSIFPTFKGYTTSGQSSDFEFNCPTDKKSDYIDLQIKFFDKNIIDKIACIYLTVYGISKKDGKESLYYIYEQTYEVRRGTNFVKIRNYLKEPNVELSIGYILKSDLNKEYPRFEKITCKS